VVCDGLLVALLQRRGLVGFDMRDGAVVWEQELGVENPYGRPVVTEELLVTGSNTKVLHHYTGEPAHLAVLRWRSGEVVWNRPILPARYPTGLMVSDGLIYLGTPDGEAFCFDLDSGDLQWRFQTGDDLLDMIPARRGVRSILAAPMLLGDHVLICGCDGCLYVLDRLTGECESQQSFGSPISATPCPVEDGFCVGTYDGRLYCFGSSRE
jgi:outer membrane protein assembly factor BamB